MRALPAAVVTALLAAACAGPLPPGPGGVPGLTVTSRAVGPRSDIIELEVEHRSPGHRVRRIALIRPDGREWLPFDVRQETLRVAPGAEERSVGVGVGGGSAEVGAGITVGTLLEGPPRHRTRALIQVPDPVAYRGNPEEWRIDVTIADAGGRFQVLSFAAPAPGK